MSFRTVADFKSTLQRKALVGAVWVADHSTAALTDICSTGGVLSTLTGHTCLGKITADGIGLADSVSLQQDRGWGDAYPSRVDVESEDATLSWTSMETNAAVIDAFFGVDQSAIVPNANGTITFDKPPLPVVRDKRALALFMDNNPDGSGEIYMGLYYLRTNIAQNGDWTAAFTSPGLGYPLQASALMDDTAGTPIRFFMGGPGLASLTSDMGY